MPKKDKQSFSVTESESSEIETLSYTGENVSVVTVTYRTGQILRECLHNLRGQRDVAEIIVVDNGNASRDEDWLDHLAANDPTVKIIRPGRNIGFAAACNLGAATATGHYLAFVNPDLIIPPGSFAKLTKVFTTHKAVWLCGARLLGMDAVEQRGGRREVLTPWRCFVEMLRLDRLAPGHPYFRRLHLIDEQPACGVTAVPVVSGACMFMARERFLALGGMDERMFLHTEDVDLCVRVLLSGGQVAYCGHVPVYHQLSSSDVCRFFVEWHKTRSTAYYFFKHFRNTYPVWSLMVLAGMLWLRFVFVALRHLPRDFVRLARRRQR